MSTSALTVDETSRGYAGWKTVFACFLLAVAAWGFGFYGHTVYLAELRKLYDWPTSLISTATTAYYLFGGVIVIWVSDAVRRFGPRNVALVGLVTLSGSGALLALVREPWQLYGAFLLMSFGWAGSSIAIINNILGLWFSARRGMAISFALNGASVAGIVFAPALVALIGVFDFATAMTVAAIATLLIVGPAILLWVDWPPHRAHATAASPAPSGTWTRPRALRSLQFWTVAAPFALALVAQVGFLVHLIAFLEPTIGRYLSGVALSLASICAVIGRVGMGFFIDRLNQRLVTAMSLASQAAALFLMIHTSDTVALIALASLFGLSVGNLITLPSLIVQREFEAASFGMLMALSAAINQFTYAFGPALLGVVKDFAGGYPAALGVCIGCQLVAIAIILSRRSPPQPLA
ncbi:MAG: MFS transporter [Alphaproteobacteria bacterium]|nr:MFS transporter [Alphaproteobacteria bacterium]MCW5739277.1 MFS transporter [Alphaproteobacteria bacterium]